MIRHNWTVVCSHSTIDADTNNISLIEVLEQLSIKGPPFTDDGEPVIPIEFDVVTLWSRSNLDQLCQGQARLQLLAPSGVSLMEKEYPINLSSHSRMRSRTRFAGFPLKGSGLYQFQVQFREEDEGDWQDAASVLLQISIETPSNGESQS